MSSFWADALRTVIAILVLALLFLSQRYWFGQARRLIERTRHPLWRRALRGLWYLATAALLAVIVLRLAEFRLSGLLLVGLWLMSSFAAYLLVKLVHGTEWLWTFFADRRDSARRSESPAAGAPANASRRYFFQRAAYFAGAVPFVGAAYGFLAGRMRYRVERVEVPIPNLPGALDGLRIAQLSDFHIGAYMPREGVRRAVEMANELGAELCVVTGDYVTMRSDPLEDCIEELAALRAPLGVWGCLGNHEIYADVEDEATRLLRAAGARVLRYENAEVAWRGQAFNLIGMDYEGSTHSGRRRPRLSLVEPLVRRDVPNVLLSHNPNSFFRAAELGIELTLAGHTHGGQVQVEILHRHLNPARFFTPYVAGLYSRPNSASDSARHWLARRSQLQADVGGPLATSSLYVNCGIGTIGAPIRLNAPPEITLLTLRRA